jgi:ABC-type transport system involved in cytochrome bd biosynthesis fused ATPase/permease subunit
VPPTAAVLPGSLAENLAPDAPTDRRRLETARAALVALGDRVLSALPDHAELGPRGRRPSSGEAQRLALARAIASDQPVLLLDEPTANLDADGEARAIALLARISKERTVVLVSHRPGPRAIARTIVDLADVDTRAPLAAVG